MDWEKYALELKGACKEKKRQAEEYEKENTRLNAKVGELMLENKKQAEEIAFLKLFPKPQPLPFVVSAGDTSTMPTFRDDDANNLLDSNVNLPGVASSSWMGKDTSYSPTADDMSMVISQRELQIS